MHRDLLIRGLAVCCGLVLMGLCAVAPVGATPVITVVAKGLDQPKKLSVSSGGDVLVAESGDGVAPASCTDGAETSCEDHSGAVAEVTPAGTVTTLLSGLTSISSGHDAPQATGPVEARIIDGRLDVLYQDLGLNATTGVSTWGASSLLGDLVSYSTTGSSHNVLASFGVYEARHEPDKDELGSAVHYGYEGAINSDPYSFAPYKNGYVVADAGANDVLYVSDSGAITVLAVLPTITEYAKAGTFGSSQKTAIEAQAQSVPTAVAIAPDGDIYVGELGGVPSAPGSSDIYRIVPGHRATVYARGFTTISDLALTSSGKLLVLELDKKGLNDPGMDDDRPASGELIERNGTARHVLVSSGLPMATGLAVSGRYVYIAIDGVTSATDGSGGELVRVTL